jgi:hypothetical protein
MGDEVKEFTEAVEVSENIDKRKVMLTVTCNPWYLKIYRSGR